MKRSIVKEVHWVTNLSEQVLQAINHDLKNTIFSFIPNTAEVAFYGLLKGMEDYLNKIKIERILSWDKDFDEEKLTEMINRRIRVEKVAIKDVKMRTFITEDSSRNEMVQHVYDITYGTVEKRNRYTGGDRRFYCTRYHIERKYRSYAGTS